MDSWKRDKAFRSAVRVGRRRGLSKHRSERCAVHMLMLDDDGPILSARDIPRTPCEFNYVKRGSRQVRPGVVRDATTGRFISAADIGANDGGATGEA